MTTTETSVAGLLCRLDAAPSLVPQTTPPPGGGGGGGGDSKETSVAYVHRGRVTLDVTMAQWNNHKDWEVPIPVSASSFHPAT